MWRRKPWIVVLGVAVAIFTALPFADAGWSFTRGFETYVTHWSFGGSLFPLFALVFGDFARPIAILVGALVVVRAMRIHWAPERIALWAGGAFVLLSPTVHPWYVLWAWVPALLCGVRAWTVLATLIPLSYAALATYDPGSSTWTEPWWPTVVIAVPFLTVFIYESLRHVTLPGPWGPGQANREPSVPSRGPDAGV
jgi:hypothetical protein